MMFIKDLRLKERVQELLLLLCLSLLFAAPLMAEDTVPNTESEPKASEEQQDEDQPPVEDHVHLHHMTAVEAQEGTCIQERTIAYWYCDDCGEMFRDESGETALSEEEIADGLGDHNFIDVEGTAVEPTCTEEGRAADQICEYCGETQEGEVLPPAGHQQITTIIPATMENDGTAIYTCAICGESTRKDLRIRKIESITTASKYVDFTGENAYPEIIVTNAAGNRISASYYTVQYPKKSKVPGTYTAQVTLHTRYAVTVEIPYTIRIKTPQITNIIKTYNRRMTVGWTRDLGVTGYEIVYRTLTGEPQTIRVLSNTQRTKLIKGLLKGKKYYVKVRSFAEVGTKTYYSAYSKVYKTYISLYNKQSSLKKLLQSALLPVGSTLYVWGGGHIDGKGSPAVTLGVSPRWQTFFDANNKYYDFTQTRYQSYDGLDCSGFVGWTVYNAINTRNDQENLVMGSTYMASDYSGRGWGSYTYWYRVRDHRPGDIMSTTGHVYIVIGECSDGSIVVAHSSPPGVQLAGTATPYGKWDSEAVELAKTYMKKYYYKFYKRYGVGRCSTSYLTDYNRMRWDVTGRKMMTDKEGYRYMSAEEVLKDLFNES